MLAVAAAAVALLALAGAATAGSWLARRSLEPELRRLRGRVRELSERLAATGRSTTSRVASDPALRGAPRDDADARQPARGPRTLH